MNKLNKKDFCRIATDLMVMFPNVKAVTLSKFNERLCFDCWYQNSNATINNGIWSTHSDYAILFNNRNNIGCRTNVMTIPITKSFDEIDGEQEYFKAVRSNFIPNNKVVHCSRNDFNLKRIKNAMSYFIHKLGGNKGIIKPYNRFIIQKDNDVICDFSFQSAGLQITTYIRNNINSYLENAFAN